VRLVLQCGMCGTHHPVGTAVCSTCRASGVPQLRLMLECPTCGHLGITPSCERCPPVVPLELDAELIVAEEVVDELLPLDPIESDEFDSSEFTIDLNLDDMDEEDESAVIFEDDEEDGAVIIHLTKDSLDEDDEDEVEYEDEYDDTDDVDDEELEEIESEDDE
jgi:hypothetical protein